MNLKELENSWMQQFAEPVIIAGPCSAESEAQLLETAQRIKNSGTEISLFRAGIWKPRTKPNGFEGVGAIGLNWLKKVKEEFGFKTTTEVANAHHVQAALNADVDVLWIGARSTANPFTVQEIADALKGTGKTVLVKNPVNPDIGLWIGAMERLMGGGITELGAIHRGFSTYRKTEFRNIPNWQIAIDFKNQYPNIPLLVDPSHICGNRTGLFSVAQEALNLGYQGIMIETHCDPDAAWSDVAQQITPEKMVELIGNLKVRSREFEGFEDEIELHRTFITELDMQLMDILSQRMKIAEKIGTLKKANNAIIFQPERWRAITDFAAKRADETGMSREFVERLFKTIHEQSIEVQNTVMLDENQKPKDK